LASINDLTTTVQRLRNAAPQQFEEFRTAFRVYTADIVRDFVMAENKLEQMQGQAQQCRKFSEILEKTK
jgi:hypothetical protein